MRKVFSRPLSYGLAGAVCIVGSPATAAPYQASAENICADTNCIVRFAPPPAGSTLRVTHFGCYAATSNFGAFNRTTVSIETTWNGAPFVRPVSSYDLAATQDRNHVLTATSISGEVVVFVPGGARYIVRSTNDPLSSMDRMFCSVTGELEATP